MTIFWWLEFSWTNRNMSHFPDKALKYIYNFSVVNKVEVCGNVWYVFSTEASATRTQDLLPSPRLGQTAAKRRKSIQWQAQVEFLISTCKALPLDTCHFCFQSEDLWELLLFSESIIFRSFTFVLLLSTLLPLWVCVDQGVMAIKEYSAPTRFPESELLYQMQFSVISKASFFFLSIIFFISQWMHPLFDGFSFSLSTTVI